ncbi:MAG: hypothetical protein F6K65_13205 [Moorea sp. SIO3C2]|nr:hypothetical protein [Moorena sp. SIO3C2]
MGILPVPDGPHLWNGHQAWNRHLACYSFPAGTAQSTPIHSKTDATPELWLMAEPSEYNCVVII